jgi:hypothetical protein
MSENPHEDLAAFLVTERAKAVLVGRSLGLEEAASRIEALGGKFAFLISPGVAAREIRALKDK